MVFVFRWIGNNVCCTSLLIQMSSTICARNTFSKTFLRGFRSFTILIAARPNNATPATAASTLEALHA